MENFKNLSTDEDLYWFYYDDTPRLKGFKDGITQEQIEKLISAKQNKKKLPFCSVANLIHILDKDKIIEYVINNAGCDFRALYWTDLQRVPIDIPYHEFFNEESRGWQTISYIVEKGVIISSEEEDENIRDYYYDKSYLIYSVINKFTDSNMLHLQVAFVNISIRKIDENKYVVIETENLGNPSDNIIPK